MRVTFMVVGLILTMWLIGQMQQKSFEDCMNAGIQSEDTCKLYSY